MHVGVRGQLVKVGSPSARGQTQVTSLGSEHL